MGIGASVFLIAVGAILAFAIQSATLGWLDLNTAGWVLIAAGLIGLAITLIVWNNRRREVVVEERPHTTVRERRTIEDEPL